MPYGMYISGEGASAQSARLAVIANNLANVDTVGFKRELAVLQSRQADASAQCLLTSGSASSNDVGGVSLRQTATDFTAGSLRPTKVPTDMAIRGDGFFSVKKDNEVLLTRAGNFQVNARGELLTQQGYPVLAEGNAPVIIARPEMPWQVSASGDIQQAGESQKLAIVKPASLGDLVKVGENLFRPLAATSPVTNPDVAGGQLEVSGSNPTSEMVEMIETTRAIEANLNLVQSQDQLADALFTRILKS